MRVYKLQVKHGITKQFWQVFPIKLGLIQQFVTVMGKEFSAFKYLQDLFATLSGTKVKAGVFVELQIKKILKCK